MPYGRTSSAMPGRDRHWRVAMHRTCFVNSWQHPVSGTLEHVLLRREEPFEAALRSTKTAAVAVNMYSKEVAPLTAGSGSCEVTSIFVELWYAQQSHATSPESDAPLICGDNTTTVSQPSALRQDPRHSGRTRLDELVTGDSLLEDHGHGNRA